jgi:hypothetical protein
MMTTTSKKFSDDLNPEIPRERIIDALKSSNKLDAAQANATYRLRNEIKEHQRQMGASHDALSDQIDKKANWVANVIVGDVEAQLKERNEVLLEYFKKLEKPMELIDKIYEMVLMRSGLPSEIKQGEFLEDPEDPEENYAIHPAHLEAERKD